MNERFFKVINEDGTIDVCGGENVEISNDYIEITENEFYDIWFKIKEQHEAKIRDRVATSVTTSPYDIGFNEGYEQAILDMLELEYEEESEE